ncbi:MAG: PAS domain S-box protein [Candidatus Sericytochromatia bacterium]|nr:PAS domain S-box protein [Candidatus Sericytochromatia bacterium]
MEKVITQREDYYRDIIDNIPAMIWITDSKGQCTFINKYWCDYTGTTFEENLGKGWLKCVRPDDLYTMKEAFSLASKNNTNFEVDYCLRKHDGTYTWVVSSGIPRFDQNNNFLGYSGTIVNINQRKIKEQKINENKEILELKIEITELKLKAEQDKFYNLFMNAPIGINYLKGKDHIYDFVNPRYQKSFGNRELIGKPIKEALPELNGQGIHELHDQVYLSGKPYINTEIKISLDKTNTGKLEENYYSIIYEPIFDFNNQVQGISTFVIQTTDQVVARKQVEELNKNLKKSKAKYKSLSESLEIQIQQRTEELAKSNKELERSNQDLNSFANIASHDLQEPLRVISSYTNLLARKYKDKLDKDGGEFIQYITDGTKRMKDLIEGILNYSKIQKDQQNIQSIDLNEIIKTVLANLDFSIKNNNAKITYESFPTINAQPIYMVQLFQNLISNAIKYCKKDNCPVVDIKVQKQKSHWLFSVTDNGIGINNDEIDKLFVLFQRLQSKSEYEGTGIGLANCKKIVEVYGGNIWVESKYEQGSTFYFTLPF